MRKLLVLLSLCVSLPVLAGLRIFPQDAQFGVLQDFSNGTAKINGKVLEVLPTAKVYGPMNTMLLPQATPKAGQVMVLLDAAGKVRTLWILDDEEIQRLSRQKP
ncbi:hypothetical protein [Parachitinimonas caeni]|uniref:Uncharacterized protein n=1 Tax=Parachitinimonas caeni TaxID=3031301 RepID=A0ABT7E5W4_9NEIS|nr:hypothetical protein [Parachitinimonas caeni]MDK2126312.1 hypothetical protein [Parachitinimonas caeni]